MIGVGFFDSRNNRANTFALAFGSALKNEMDIYHWNGEKILRWQETTWIESKPETTLKLVFFHQGDRIIFNRRIDQTWKNLSAKTVYFSTTGFSPPASSENEIDFAVGWRQEKPISLTEAYLRQAIAWAEGGAAPSLINPDQDLLSALHLLCQGYLAIVAGDNTERKTKVQSKDWWKIVKDVSLQTAASDAVGELLTAIRENKGITQTLVEAANQSLDESPA